MTVSNRRQRRADSTLKCSIAYKQCAAVEKGDEQRLMVSSSSGVDSHGQGDATVDDEIFASEVCNRIDALLPLLTPPFLPTCPQSPICASVPHPPSSAPFAVPPPSITPPAWWISCKEINPETIVRARDNAIETVCLLEEHFPTSILNIQVHLLVHLVDEVEIAGTVHARWMFFLERFMKTLKGFVRQRARLEGSMAKGWLVQESCVFVSEYLSRSQNNALELWSTKDDDRVVGDVPQGNGVVKQFSEEVRTKVSNYCMMNTDVVFYPTRSNPRWWYVIQIAPHSRHIFDKGGVKEDLPEHAIKEEDEANNFTSGHLHTAMSDVETSMSREETSSDDSSDESGDHESDGNNDVPFNSIDEDDTATLNSVTNTSLGINLEILLEIPHEDMLLDEVSTPLDG
ncbi:hypothetical protein L7F22_062869 [Adiantum nelumboides]|nr:hypothetical protein [Adiantum nelumboides]